MVGLSAGEENNPEIALDKGVMVLNKDNFQHVIDSNNLVIVDFYAPWYVFLYLYINFGLFLSQSRYFLAELDDNNVTCR